uniref:FecR family protein n=1 Tax=Pedobacter schmidteae TaxID=2201271 RepID=UPI000EB234F7|nr:FecR domain-containing protein [Pedobacter schmidteae]
MERLTDLFKKYADKTCTREEYAEFMAIVNKEHDFDKLMDSEWENALNGQGINKAKADQIFNTVMNSAPAPLKTKKAIRVSLLWPVTAAAVLLLAIFIFFFKTSNIPDGAQKNEIANINAGGTLNVTAQNEHRKIKLPDGSIVILNNASTLEFPEVFSGKTREVVLKGEGYFDIKHRNEQPFIVHTGKISTTVLGTAFNIRAFDKEKDVVVTVTRGKVMVKNENKMLGFIVPDQQIVFNKSQMTAALIPVTAREIVEWQGKDLFFDDVTMNEATAELSKRFNVKITFENVQSKDCRFTATFLRGENLDEILEVITSFNHITYKKKAGEIIISGNGCK